MSDLASTSEKVTIPKAALDWLMGAGPDPAGFWFGDFPEDQARPRGAFWWRKTFSDILTHYERTAALASPAPAESGEPAGYVFLNPDTGIEFSVNHPVESGEVDDAQDIRHATEFEVELVRQLNNAVATISTLRETVAGSHRDYQSAWKRAEEAEEKLRFAHPPAESPGSPSASGVGVTVKPLGWVDYTKGPGCPIRRIAQPFPGLVVWIFQSGHADHWYLSYNTGLNGKLLVVGDEDAAKAAAQADYEARIRSALSAAPTQDGGNG